MKFTHGTKRHYIAQLHAQGMTVNQAYAELRPKVADQIRPWVFTRNAGGSRVSKPMSEQYVELQHEINRVFALLDRIGNPVQTEAPKVEPPKLDAPIKAKGKRNIQDEKDFFFSEWERIRRWIADTSARTSAPPVDSLDTMRPVQAARALIENGVAATTLIYAMVMHWPKASLEMAQVLPVDFITEAEPLEGGFHRLTSYVVKLAKARQNVMLIGPAGTGKSHIARQVASLIKTEAHPDGLPYGETPMTPGATRGDLLGRHTIGGFIPSQFVEIYSGGGVFNFEEIDASDPSMLIVVNNALASNTLFNSVNGEVYEKHCDFIAMATANTFGMGADAKYTGREKLDLATIDRFRMGRVLVSLDETLARSLMFD
jgi:hypothetical protein